MMVEWWFVMQDGRKLGVSPENIFSFGLDGRFATTNSKPYWYPSPPRGGD
jgi:hypothetical protein